jgi:hypothetical protein
MDANSSLLSTMLNRIGAAPGVPPMSQWVLSAYKRGDTTSSLSVDFIMACGMSITAQVVRREYILCVEPILIGIPRAGRLRAVTSRSLLDAVVLV